MDIYIATKIYNVVAYVCLFVPRDYRIYVAEDPENLPYDPTKEPEKHTIIKNTFEEVEAAELDAQLQLKKWIYFITCNVSNLVGVMLTLWGLGATHIFEKYGTNTTLFYCSFIFYAPFLIWLRVVWFPGKKERERRKYIRDHRLWRKAVNEARRKRFLGITDDSDEEMDSKTTSRKENMSSKSMRNNSLNISMKGANTSTKAPSIQLNDSLVASSKAGPSSKNNLPTPEEQKTPGSKRGAALSTPARSSLRGIETDYTSKKSKRISFQV